MFLKKKEYPMVSKKKDSLDIKSLLDCSTDYRFCRSSGLKEEGTV
jgi:hypothetical protein